MPQISTSNCEQVFTSLVCIGNKLLSKGRLPEICHHPCVLFLLGDTAQQGTMSPPKGSRLTHQQRLENGKESRDVRK